MLPSKQGRPPTMGAFPVSACCTMPGQVAAVAPDCARPSPGPKPWAPTCEALCLPHGHPCEEGRHMSRRPAGVAGAPVCASQEGATNQWPSASVMTARGAASPSTSTGAWRRNPGTRSLTECTSLRWAGPTDKGTRPATLGSWPLCWVRRASPCQTRARPTRSTGPRGFGLSRPGRGPLALSCPLTSSRRGRVRPYRAESIRTGDHTPQV